MRARCRLLVLSLIVGLARPQHDDAGCLPSVGALPPSLTFCNGTAVTAASWPARRAQIASLLESTFYGRAPPAPPLLDVTLTNATTTRGVVCSWWRASFAAPRGGAALPLEYETLQPSGCSASTPCPALLASREQRRWLVAGVARGYVGLSLCAGDSCEWATAAWAAAFPGADWAQIAQRAFLASRLLDALGAAAGRGAGADASRVAITGHSRNGKQALIAAALDGRFAAVVDSSSGAAGIAPYRLTGGDAQGERPASAWPGPWWLPSLRGFDGREDALPVDCHSVAALVAPRPLLIASATNDVVEATFAVEAAHADAAAVYALLGAPAAALQLVYRAGEHHGYEDVQTYFDFLDAAFGHVAPGGGARPPPPFSPAPPALYHAFDWPAWAAAQGAAPPPPPPPSAPPAARVAWLLGEPPGGGPAYEPGGNYPPAGDLTYVDALQNHDEAAPRFPGVERATLAFGANIISGSALFRTDMRTRTPPRAAGWPAVVYVHGANYNKGWTAGYPVDGVQSLPHALANASIVVLTYETLGTGLRLAEGAAFYRRFPRWSKAGAAVRDVLSAVDALAAPPAGPWPSGATDAPDLPRVDVSRVFLVGYGGGGHAALFAAALDARVAGVATISGWTPLRTDTDAARSGGARRWWQAHATLPRLGYFAEGRAPQGDIPADWEDVLGLVAPRPALVVQPDADRFCNASAVRGVVGALQRGGFSNLSLVAIGGADGLGLAAVGATLSWLRAAAA
jgi:hypothetical protein